MISKRAIPLPWNIKTSCSLSLSPEYMGSNRRSIPVPSFLPWTVSQIDQTVDSKGCLRLICKPRDNLPVIALLLQFIRAAGMAGRPKLPGGPAPISGDGWSLMQVGCAGAWEGGDFHGFHLCQIGAEKGIWPCPVWKVEYSRFDSHIIHSKQSQTLNLNVMLSQLSKLFSNDDVHQMSHASPEF